MASEGSVLCEVSAPLLSHSREADMRHAGRNGATAGTSSNTMAAVFSSFLTKHLKIFERKGVNLVLLWSFSSNFVLYFISKSYAVKFATILPTTTLFVLSSLLLYPFLGWLADVHFSRYRVIKWFLRIMWLVSVLLCLEYILIDYYPLTNNTADTVLKAFFFVSLTVSLGGFQANIIQFGVDQLVDASSEEISSFICWYFWLLFSSEILIECYLHFSKHLPPIFIPVCLTIAVSSDYIFHGCLVKEPPSNNPLILIFKVLQYAAKNKYPRLRSAFTYWDDKRFSRLDLGKSKYGGPFTTEEVENVKTFWRLFGLIIIGCIFGSLIVNMYPATSKLLWHLQGKWHMYSKYYFTMKFVTLVILHLLYRFIIEPLILRRCFYIPISSEIVLGAVFWFLGLISYIIIEGVGRHLLTQDVYLSNMTCPIIGYQDKSIILPLNKMWIMFPYAFDNMARYFFYVGVVKFLYAQSPYSMKGLMLGLVFGCGGLFIILCFALLLLVQYVIVKWFPPQYGCEIWYLLFIFVFLLIIGGILCCVYKFYKFRFRDDDLENEQMFAIRYYSQGYD